MYVIFPVFVDLLIMYKHDMFFTRKFYIPNNLFTSLHNYILFSYLNKVCLQGGEFSTDMIEFGLILRQAAGNRDLFDTFKVVWDTSML